MAAQNGWSQRYTCTKCHYEITLWSDGTHFHIKSWGHQEEKPNARLMSARTDSNLICPNCHLPLPAGFQR